MTTDIRHSVVGIALHPNLVEPNKKHLAGTGFVAASAHDGSPRLVTCEHVIRADKAERHPENHQHVAFFCEHDPTRQKRWAHIECADRGGDFAILRPLEPLPDNASPLPLYDSAAKGDFSVFGYPQQGNYAGLHGQGTVLGLAPNRQNVEHLQVSSTEVTFGFSGGPI